MPMFHLHSSHGSRQGGQSARAELLYLLRRGPYAHGRDRLLASSWGNLPEWCNDDPFALVEASDLHERANGRLYCELDGALPVELELDQNIELTRAMAEKVTGNGSPYIWVIHEGQRPVPGKPRNLHWHMMYFERINDGIARDPAAWFRRANHRNPAAGGAPKDRSLKGHGWLSTTRRLYERLLNKALERAGCPERVTCESHRTRMARAEAEGDRETAEYLRRHPPGLHIGPTASAIERDQPRRPGRPSERGDRARARDAEGARLRAELTSVSGELTSLYREAIAAARDAGVDDGIVANARPDDPNTVLALDDATEIRRQEIRVAATAEGFDDEAIEGIRRTVEPDDPDLGWAAIVETINVRRERRNAAETDARAVGVDVDAAFRQAREQNEDELDFIERKTAECKRTLTAAREALLNYDAIERIRREAESKRRGSQWVVLARTTEERVEQKAAIEVVAGCLDVNVDAVYAAAREHGQDPVTALDHRVKEVLDRRDEALRSMSTGTLHRSAAARELFGEKRQATMPADRESVIREAERRVEAELPGREGELRSIPPGERCLAQAKHALLGGAERSPTLVERESIITRAERRLGKELDHREDRFIESGGSAERLAEAFGELCDDERFGDGSSLSERWQIITLAEEWYEQDRAADTEWSANLDRAEEMLRALAIGAEHLSAARLEVVAAGQDPSSLEARERVVDLARRRVEEELDDRGAEVRATKRGPAWLNDAKWRTLSEDDREPTLEERERILETVEQQIRADLDRRKNSIGETDEGVLAVVEGAAATGGQRHTADAGGRRPGVGAGRERASRASGGGE